MTFLVLNRSQQSKVVTVRFVTMCRIVRPRDAIGYDFHLNAVSASVSKKRIQRLTGAGTRGYTAFKEPEYWKPFVRIQGSVASITMSKALDNCTDKLTRRIRIFFRYDLCFGLMHPLM